jgi:hypothetical protein
MHVGFEERSEHDEANLVYRHPLIRYDTSSGNATLRGLCEGSFFLQAFIPPAEMVLDGSGDAAIAISCGTTRFE